MMKLNRNLCLLIAGTIAMGLLTSCNQNTKNPDVSGTDSQTSTETQTEAVTESSTWKNGDIFANGDYASEVLATANDRMLNYAVTLFEQIYNTYLADGQHSVVMSVIPDKNYYMTQTESTPPTVDYNAFFDVFKNGTAGFSAYVDLTDALSLDDYYYTDIHWKQECILPAANLIAQAFGHTLNAEYTQETVDVEFIGSYTDEAPDLGVRTDTLTYLSGEVFDGVTVTNYNDATPSDGVLYETDITGNRNTYEVFLSGPTPLQIIENANAATDRELIIFRDSFGSALAPLFCEAYAKITLVDLRYIQSSVLNQFITFEDQDVLFIYSTNILYTAMVMK